MYILRARVAMALKTAVKPPSLEGHFSWQGKISFRGLRTVDQGANAKENWSSAPLEPMSPSFVFFRSEKSKHLLSDWEVLSHFASRPLALPYIVLYDH